MFFQNKDGKRITLAIADAIKQNKDYLSEIDGLIGDGDHGINMNKGFSLFADKVKDIDMDFSKSLHELGMTLLSGIGGSMGPLYGTLFNSMASVSKGYERIDVTIMGEMLEKALEGIKSIGGAEVGDKTLVDCMQPAFEAYKNAQSNGADFKEALSMMKKAAVEGRDSAKAMVAKLGRASRLGERSRGVLDAGATSCCIILCVMADTILDILG